MYSNLVRKFIIKSKTNNDVVFDTPQFLSKKDISLCSKFVNSELKELQKAKNIEEQSDAIADTIYYLLNFSCKNGINIDSIFVNVHKANMRKIENQVIKNKSGKVLKPKGWVGPDEDNRKTIDYQSNYGAFNNNKILHFFQNLFFK